MCSECDRILKQYHPSKINLIKTTYCKFKLVSNQYCCCRLYYDESENHLKVFVVDTDRALAFWKISNYRNAKEIDVVTDQFIKSFLALFNNNYIKDCEEILPRK